MKKLLLVIALLFSLSGCKNPPRIQGYKADLKCEKEISKTISEGEAFSIDNRKIISHVHLKDFDLFDSSEILSVDEQQAILDPYTEYWPKNDIGQDTMSLSLSDGVVAEIRFREGNLEGLRLVTDFQHANSYSDDFRSEYYDSLPFHIGD